MAMTVRDVEDLLRLLREHPEWRARLRDEIMGMDWEEFRERSRAIDAQLQETGVLVREVAAMSREALVEARASLSKLDGQQALLAEIDELLRQHDARLDAHDGRFDRVDAKLAEHDGRFDRVDAKLAEHDERFDRIDAKLTQHDERFDRVEGRLEGVEGRLEGVEGRLEGVEGRLEGVEGRLEGVEGRLEGVQGRLGKVEGRLGNVEGGIYEMRFNVAGRIARHFSRARPVHAGDLDELLAARERGVITDAEFDQVAALDHLFLARRGRGAEAPSVYVAVEVSQTIHRADVERAAARAAILRRVGFDAEAVAAGREVDDATRAYASGLGVHVVAERNVEAA
jgi:DNA repair exonuclease SbcCD ATPase subunit